MSSPVVHSFPMPNGAATETLPFGADAPQILTNAYAVLGETFSIGDGQQVSIDMIYVPGESGGKVLNFQIEVSPDSMATDDTTSKWFPLGAQSNAGGTLTTEPYTYQITGGNSGVAVQPVPLEFSSIHQKARIKVEETGVVTTFGTAQARINKLPLVAAS